MPAFIAYHECGAYLATTAADLRETLDRLARSPS
jgi:hypothetical protein